MTDDSTAGARENSGADPAPEGASSPAPEGTSAGDTLAEDSSEQAPGAAEAAAEEAGSQRVKTRARRGRARKRRRARLLQLGVLIGVILVWWLITVLRLVDPLYLPSPFAVLRAFIDANRCVVVDDETGRTVCGVLNYYLWEHLVASLQRMAVGIIAAAILGVLLGFVMSMWEAAHTAFSPYLNFLRALPPLGYIGLIIVWVGIGDTSKYLLLFLAAFPPIVIATIEGVRGIRSDYIAAARSMGAGPVEIARYVVLPGATASIVSGVRLAVGFAWTTVVAAELNNGIPGIGGLAYISGTQLHTALTIASIIVIGLVAVALDGCIRLIGDRLVPWHGKV